jgi:ribonuclease D
LTDIAARPTTLVETPEAFQSALEAFRREPALGVDTEANSFFVYRERTCLVQVSSADADWILDPFKVDLTPFGEILGDPAIEKIFHASEIVVRGLYDTSIAAKAVGRKKLGLAGLLEEILQIKIAKDEQRSDWGRRPLTKEQIEYAFLDTRHLITLAGRLKAEVHEKGFDEEVAVDCQRVSLKEPRPREVDPEAFEKHTSARKMDPVSRQILRALYQTREARAKETDKPPFRVASDEALGEIAVRKAATKADMVKVPGITPAVLGRHGDALVAAVEGALAEGPLPFKRKVFVAPDPLEEERYERLRAWRRKVADARQVEVEVIGGNAMLKALAKANPPTLEALATVEELDAYRRARYGEAMLKVLQTPPSMLL